MILYFFAFLSGLVTIFAPCIWPLLPIILSSGASEGPKKPLGIIVGLSISFLFFTLLLASLLKVFPIDPEIFRALGVLIIMFFGITLLVPKLTVWLEGAVSRFSARFGSVGAKQGNGFGGGVVTGAALGVVWSPCAGPILATVATLAATSGVSLTIFLIALAFVLGVSVPLFFIAFLGQQIFAKMRRVNKYTPRIQQAFGVLVITAGVMIYTGYDKTLQAKIIALCGGSEGFLGAFEESGIVTQKLSELRGQSAESTPGKVVAGSSLPDYGAAAEFVGISQWLNTEDGKPLSLYADLKGKVVLIDFWTYSCINCIRTLPYVEGWYEKYKEAGFTVVGIHTPEFLFEHKTENVKEAIQRYALTYPVAQDNEYATWQAYKNRYWPAHYLIDAEGRIRYTHFGEGNYEETEAAIQSLLKEVGRTSQSGFVEVEAEAGGSGKQTPETYVGLNRMERFQSTPKPVVGEQIFMLTEAIPLHAWGYKGTWTVEAERAIAGPDAAIQLRAQAKKIFLVMGANKGSAPVEVWLDGKRIEESLAGRDVQEGKVTVNEERLYELMSGEAVGEHTIELIFPEGNVSVYAFTFS